MIDKEMQERVNAVRKRVAEGRISRIIPYQELTSGDPSKETMLGRLEAYLQTGVVIDHDDLIKVIDEYKFSPKEYDYLVVILNPHLSSRDLTKYLQIEGYVMANNWHNNASELLVDENFEGIGTIDRNEKGLYLARGDFSELEPHQFPTYFYVFRKVSEK